MCEKQQEDTVLQADINSKKSKIIRIVFVVLFICVLLSSYLLYAFLNKSFLLGPLGGAVNAEKIPEFSLGAMADGSYQTKLENYYNENFPARPIYIRTANQIRYSLLNETQITSDFVVGDNKRLFERTTLDWYLGIEEERLENDYIRERIIQLKRLQEICEENNKAFILLIDASPPQYYSEDLPWNYKLIEPNIQRISENNYNTVLALLDEFDVNYMDSNDIIQNSKEQFDTPLFASTAYHWSFPTAAKVGGELIDTINKQNNLNITPMEIKDYYVSDKPLKIDADINDMINVFSGVLDPLKYYYPLYDANPTANTDYPSAFFMGCSFGNVMVDALASTPIFNQFDHIYNSSMYYKWPAETALNAIYHHKEQLEPDYDNWLKNKDIIIFDATDISTSYLGGSMFESMLAYLETNGFPKDDYSQFPEGFDVNTAPKENNNYVFGIRITENNIAVMRESALFNINASSSGSKNLVLKYSPRDLYKNLSEEQQKNAGIRIYVNGVMTNEIPLTAVDEETINIDVKDIASDKHGLYHVLVTSNETVGDKEGPPWDWDVSSIYINSLMWEEN